MSNLHANGLEGSLQLLPNLSKPTSGNIVPSKYFSCSEGVNILNEESEECFLLNKFPDAANMLSLNVTLREMLVHGSIPLHLLFWGILQLI